MKRTSPEMLDYYDEKVVRRIVEKHGYNAMPQMSKKSGVKIGLMDGKWKLPTWEEDKAMDHEIEADFEASLERPL